MTTSLLETYMQEKVNEVAVMLIKEFPEIAENEPKRIGQMAKAIVFDAMSKAIDMFAESTKDFQS